MPGNQDWCNALFGHYFKKENAGKEVLLYCDHKVIADVGREAFRERFAGENDEKIISDFQRIFSEFPKPSKWFESVEKAYEESQSLRYPANEGKPYGPPFFTYLLMTIVVIAQNDDWDADSANKLNASAYYEPLVQYFKSFNKKFADQDTESLKNQFNSNFKKLQKVWNQLTEYTSKILKKNFGYWAINQNESDPHIHVRIPRSQVIFKPVHLTRGLPTFFKEIVGIIEPKDWSAVIVSDDFKSKFPNAHRFDNRDFVINYLKGRWEAWRNEEDKERKAKSGTLDTRYGSSSSGTGASVVRYGSSSSGSRDSKNRRKKEDKPPVPKHLRKKPGKKPVEVVLNWGADAQGELFFTPWEKNEFTINERTYRFKNSVPFEEIWNKKHEKYRFIYEGRNGLKNVVVLTEYDEDIFKEYTGENPSFLTAKNLVFVCPGVKTDDFERLIPSARRVREYDDFVVYRCEDFRDAEKLKDFLGIKPKLIGISGLTSENKAQKRTFLNIDEVFVTLKHVPKNAEIVAESENYRCKLVPAGKGDNSEERTWFFKEFSPAGHYTLYYNDRPLNPKQPIILIEAEINESVGENVPWRNLYGEICAETDGPAYKGLRLNKIALEKLDVVAEDPLIASLLINLAGAPQTVPDFEIPRTPADRLLYYLSERNELSWKEFKDAKGYFADGAQPVYPSRFEPHGYIDCDRESKNHKNRVKVLPPALVIQHDYNFHTNIKFALVGARTPDLLRKINETIGRYNGMLEFKPAKGLPTAVYCIFKSTYSARMFAKIISLQVETAVWLKNPIPDEKLVMYFNQILELLRIDLDQYFKTIRNSKHKTENIPIKSGTQGLEIWEKYDSNSQQFVALTELKSAELAKTMLVRKSGVVRDVKDTSTNNLPLYYKEKKRGITQYVRAFPLPQRWGEILYYAYLARITKSKSEWWKKVFELTNKDGLLRVRKTVELPPPIDRMAAIMDATGSEFQNAKGQPSNNPKAFRTYNVSPNFLTLLSKAFGVEFPKKK